MATVTLHQVRTNEGPDGYKIFSEITSATGMPSEIFVYTSADDQFDHVAVPLDFYWPTTKDISKPYYRKSDATKYFPSVNVALDHVEFVRRRVNELTLSMTEEATSFPGEDTTVYPLPTP